MTFKQALTIANLRAARTSVRQRITVCSCDWRGDLHFLVKPVDRVPAAVFA